MAQAFTLAYNYGYPRLMSSYQFSDHKDGPPHNPDWSTKDVECFNGEWICEHRWQPIGSMAGFAQSVKGTGVENWWSEGNQVWHYANGAVAIRLYEYTIHKAL